MKRRAALMVACGAWAAWPLRAASAPDSTSRPRVPDARLTDQDGRSRSLRALCDRPVVIGFFYTGCSTVCPPQTAALRALRERLDAQAGAPERCRPHAVRPGAKTIGARAGAHRRPWSATTA